MANAVVAWAGPRGGRLADVVQTVLRTEIETRRGDLTFRRSLGALQSGGSRMELRPGPPLADFAIVLLDTSGLHSPWVAFETGGIAAQPDAGAARPRVLVLSMCDSEEPVRGTPFEQYQCAAFTLKGIALVVEAVLSWACGTVTRTDAAEVATRLHLALTQEWRLIQESERERNPYLLAELDGLVDDYEVFGLADRSKANELRQLHSSLELDPNARLGTYLSAELAFIANEFRRCATDGAFGELAAEWALEHLMVAARDKLDSISEGTLKLPNRDLVRDFWLHYVFARAQFSVWTTNFGRPGENIGGVADDQLLGAQTGALDRNVEITRLFVYDPGMPEDEARQRREVMRQQIGQNIDVRAITAIDFRLRADAERAEERIGGRDFMIIDDALIYVTHPDSSHEVSAVLYRNGPNDQRVAAARAFKDTLARWSDQITLENLSKFPGVLA
jgi:hypothetical protein